MTDQPRTQGEREPETPMERIENLIRRAKLVSRTFRSGGDPTLQIRRLDDAVELAEEMRICGHRIIDDECVIGSDGKCS